MSKTEKITTEKAQIPTGPYSQGIRFGNLLFVAGQIGVDKATDQVYPTLEQQVISAMENLGAVLDAGGSSFSKLVKVTLFITDMKDFAQINGIYQRFIQEPYPVRTCVEVRGLPKGACFEVEAIATINEKEGA